MHDTDKEQVFHGSPAAPGVARGSAFVFQHEDPEVPVYQVAEAELSREQARFEEALVATREELQALREQIAAQVGEAEASVFDAHLLVLEDRALIEETLSASAEKRVNIDHCFASVAERYIEFFEHIEDAYLRERASDIRDVTKRVLAHLLGRGGFRSFGDDGRAEARVFVANNINASDIAQLPREKILALVAETGGQTGHTYIMARAMKVPAVVGVAGVTEKIAMGVPVLVDGYDGTVIVDPGEDTLFRYGEFRRKRKRLQEVYESELGEPAETRDGRPCPLRANLETREEVVDAKAVHAEGVGLFRSEGMVLRDRAALASEELQFREYREVVRALDPAPVTIRTFDIGGDKYLPSRLTVRERNPFMGFRAIRYCLKNPGLFKEQLRALLRAASYGNLRILLPMISGVRELHAARELLAEARAELRARGEEVPEAVALGCMIEIPSAALMVDVLAKYCDFVSIGTNDLIQYLLAVDRGNDNIAELHEPSHPAVVRILHTIVREAKAAGVPVSVCGEMASDPVYTGLLVGLGVDELSLSPSLLPEVKYILRHMDAAEAEALAAECLRMEGPRRIRRRLGAFHEELVRRSALTTH